MSSAAAFGSARSIVGAVFRQRRKLLALSLWSLAGALPTFAAGHAIARATDGFLAERPATGLAWLGVLVATVPVGAWGARHTYLGIAALVEPLRDELVRLVVDGALRRSTRPGVPQDTAAVARLTQHVEMLRETVARLLLIVFGFVAAVAATLTGLLTLTPLVAPMVVGPLVVAIAAFGLTLPTMTRRQRRLLLADERLAERTAQVAHGLRDVVACGAEDRCTSELDELIDEQARAGAALSRAAAMRTTVVAIGAHVPVVLILVSAGWLLRRGVSAGALLGILTYLVQGLEPALSSLTTSVATPLAQLAVTVRRLDEERTPALVPSDEPQQGQRGGVFRHPNGRLDDTTPQDATVLVRGVTFRYRRAAEPVVRDLDLTIADGDHLAVVGPSGAGKSTLAALMVGLLRPDAGSIRHGNVPVEVVPYDERVLIPQEAYVFRGTLGENLRYLRADASAAVLAGAIEAIGLVDLVERIGGYDTELDPAKLSSGERQLVALTRAYVARARLILLDEATCHLDPQAEARAEEAFASRDGTLVVVAHRISSARRAQRILVMDGADIMLGTHHDLLNRSPLYQDLVGHWDAADPTPDPRQ